jgi:HEPN domain-containing protein
MDNLHTLHWFEFAEDDLDSAKILVEHGSRKTNAVCFHAQQSVEKNLKSYLVANGIAEPPHIHNLMVLKAMCEDFDPRFSEITEQCNRLNPYGVRAKYPDEIVIDENDAKEAIADAQFVMEFAPIVSIRTALETEYRKQFTVTQVTAITDIKPQAEKPEEQESNPL